MTNIIFNYLYFIWRHLCMRNNVIRRKECQRYTSLLHSSPLEVSSAPAYKLNSLLISNFFFHCSHHSSTILPHPLELQHPRGRPFKRHYRISFFGIMYRYIVSHTTNIAYIDRKKILHFKIPLN